MDGTFIRGGAAVGAVLLLGVGSATLVGRIRRWPSLTLEPNERTIDLVTADPDGLWVEGEGDARLRVALRDWGAAAARRSLSDPAS